MPPPLNLGIDFGSLGLRGAYLDQDRLVVLPADVLCGNFDKWRQCEPSSATGIGVAFSSIKNRLGMTNATAKGDAAQSLSVLVTDLLRLAKSAAETSARTSMAQVALVVPARYSASRRAALREAALKAGFTEAHLLNDTMAAVLAHMHGNEQPATLLVCSVGYAGFELGLVRAVRGHLRTLGYEGGDIPSGAFIDAHLLRAWLATLAERNLMIDTQIWTDDLWLKFQTGAQQVKEQLSVQAEAIFPVPVSSSDKRQLWQARFGRSGIEGLLDQLVSPMLELTEKLLEESSLKAADINEVLLVGGTTRIPHVAELIEKRLGRKALPVGPDALARGAALYSARMESVPEAAAGEKELLTSESVGAPLNTMTVRVNLVAAETHSSAVSADATAGEPLVISAMAPVSDAQPSPPPSAALEFPRSLIAQRSFARAQSYLEELIRRAQDMLRSLQARPDLLPPVPPDARWAINQAFGLLKEGKLEEAVRQSHLAWQLAPSDPKVFDQMIEVHRLAAQAKTDLESHADAQRWLLCAYQHDRSNSPMRQALADRYYEQARQLAERSRTSEARAALKQCLELSPEHEAGSELQRTLTRK